jgi:hypothetical protein
VNPIEKWRQEQASSNRAAQLRGAGVTTEEGDIDEERAKQIAGQFGVSPTDPNLDWRFMAQSSKNIQANTDYWNDPQVQEGFRQQAEIGRQAQAAEKTGYIAGRDERTDYGIFPKKGMENLPTLPNMPKPSGKARPDDIFPPVKFPERRKEKGTEGPSAVGELIKRLPPELLGITGPAGVAAAVGQELIDPTAAYAAPLASGQKVEAFEKSFASLGQKQDEGSQALLKQLQSDPEYLRAKAEAAGQQPQPPQPQLPQQPPPQPPAEAPREGGGAGGSNIANAIKEAITTVMDKYWR